MPYTCVYMYMYMYVSPSLQVRVVPQDGDGEGVRGVVGDLVLHIGHLSQSGMEEVGGRDGGLENMADVLLNLLLSSERERER